MALLTKKKKSAQRYKDTLLKQRKTGQSRIFDGGTL